MIHFESSYNSVKINAIQGAKLVNNVPVGKEKQLYQVGQSVNSTELSRYKFVNREIVGVYKDNGYFYYQVCINGCIRTFRQIDITL